jgi:hypothetical protein
MEGGIIMSKTKWFSNAQCTIATTLPDEEEYKYKFDSKISFKKYKGKYIEDVLTERGISLIVSKDLLKNALKKLGKVEQIKITINKEIYFPILFEGDNKVKVLLAPMDE